MSIGLYRFHWDYGGMGDVEGIFVASEEDVSSLIGKEVYFGEILGKHSEIYGIVEDSDLVLLTTNEEAINIVRTYNLSTGYNPLDYLEE